jgi:hypothetical protein
MLIARNRAIFQEYLEYMVASVNGSCCARKAHDDARAYPATGFVGQKVHMKDLVLLENLHAFCTFAAALTGVQEYQDRCTCA